MHSGEKQLYMSMAMPLTHESDEEIFKVTGCKPCCTINEISAKLVGRDTIEKDNDYANLYIEDAEDYVVIGLYYVSNKVTVKGEYYTYDTANIIADFGGYLGLLLGYSILGFYDNSIGVLSRLRANWKKYASKDDSTE